MTIGNDPEGTNRIYKADAGGLSAEPGSVAYLVAEIERHFHNRERWFGLAATPSGETHRADRMAGGIAPFVLTAGNDDFGPWVQVIGSEDTPVTTGAVSFDAHRAMVTDTNSTNAFLIQIAVGESADLAAAVAADNITEFPYTAASNNNDSGITDVMTRRVLVGSKVWARVVCIGANAPTISIYFGIHEYEG